MTDRRFRRNLVTPEGVALEVELATAGARASAFMLDSILLVGVLALLTFGGIATVGSLGLQSATGVFALWLLASFLLRSFYFVLFETGARAATPGKRLLKLRVVSRGGGRLSSAAVLARNLMREVEIFMPMGFVPYMLADGAAWWTALIGLAWTLLFLLMPLFNRDRMRAGDIVGGTWVVRQAHAAILPDVALASSADQIAPFTEAELAPYGQFELQRLEQVLRVAEPDVITTVAATIRAKIGRKDERQDLAFLEAYYLALRQHLERRLLLGQRKRNKFDPI